MKLKPLSDRVVIKMVEAEETTKSGGAGQADFGGLCGRGNLSGRYAQGCRPVDGRSDEAHYE